ncbi:MAG: DegT/DnrJ/EryC1/StrS aminotransferase family protein [Elusimicrobia bacterium]|nr:DegT/DnrJ/EryC1/StrS aminotransferase family protein [Elusimicrobiota bacterium]
MRKTFLPFHVPHVADEEVRAVARVLKSGWMTTGPEVRRFEREFARYIGAKHAVAVNSGTAALHLALLSLGLKEGDEVIVPTMTFTATAEVALYFKAKPVLVDCRTDTLNMDPELIERAVTRRTRAVIPVHFGGHPCDMDPILAVAERRGLAVIEDAAHAPPSRYGRKMVGTLGDMGCFSFHAVKPVTTGEGGMLVTNDPARAAKARLLSLHGISKDAWKRYNAAGSWRYEVITAGYKYNMTDIAAAIGLCQLAKCEASWRIRESHAERYTRAFRELPEIEAPTVLPAIQHAWHLYVIRLNLERLSISRDAFIERLRELNIGTSVHFIPLHLQPYYRKSFRLRPEDFPRATAASNRNISLPIYPGLRKSDVEYVIDSVSRIVKQNRR